MMIASLSDKVFGFTCEKHLFSAPCRVLLGLSGGADSMALLHLLAHWPDDGLDVYAVHIHHGLREQSADRDEEFVRQYCTANGIPLTVIHADVSQYAQENRLSIEEAGRLVRYREFESVAKSVNADYILTAHTASDQVETVLMHMIRGCSVDGLVGIPPSRQNICRPLLCATRQEIEAYCCDHDIPFCVDETNEDTRYMRNDVRHRLLPVLREMNPAVDAALLRLIQSAEADSDYLRRLACEALHKARCRYGYAAITFVDAEPVVRRRMIRQLFVLNDMPLFEEPHILAAEQAICSGNGGVSLPKGYRLEVKQGIVSLFLENSAQNCFDDVVVRDFPSTVELGGVRLGLSMISKDDQTTQNVHKLFAKFVIDYDRICGDVRICARKTGDYIHPAGRDVGKSLKKLMNEWHVPAHLRDQYPILCDDLGVFMVPGYACDERVAPTESTKHYLVCNTDDVLG